MRTETAPHRKGVGEARTRALGWVVGVDGRPRWILGVALIAATALITVATHQSTITGGFTADNEMLYVWVCLVAFLFLPLPAALLELAVVGAAYSWLLVDERVPTDEIAARLVVTLGSLLIAGILIARLRDSLAASVAELTERARVDSLTGLLNRRALLERAALEFARSRRTGAPVAMLLIDVDDFKSLNDRHGHVAGDHALRRVAHAISGETREIDAVARLGGDEFAVLLPGATAKAGESVGRRLLASIENPDSGGAMLGHSVSVGVAVGPPVDHLLESLWRDADRAMYEAKRRGGGRVARASEVLSAPGSLRPIERPGDPGVER